MPQRDLLIIKEYFGRLKDEQKNCESDIKSIMDLIESLSVKCSSAQTSITLPRQSVVPCNICNKRVVTDE